MKYLKQRCVRDTQLDYSELGGDYDKFTKGNHKWPQDVIRPDKHNQTNKLSLVNNCLTVNKNDCHKHYQLVKDEQDDSYNPQSCILTPEKINPKGSIQTLGNSFWKTGTNNSPSCIAANAIYEKQGKRDKDAEQNVPAISCSRYTRKRTDGDGTDHYQYCDQTGTCTWTSDPPSDLSGPLNVDPNTPAPLPKPAQVPDSDPVPVLPDPPPIPQPPQPPQPPQSDNTPYIVGGTISVVVLLLLFLFIYLRRKN